MIVLLDELWPPLIKIIDKISLEDEVRRHTEVWVLTDSDQDFSSGIEFDTIIVEPLPLARCDFSATDGANKTRVSLKTAV